MDNLEHTVVPVVELLYNDDTDTSTIDHVMFISDTVSAHQIFVDSANANTFPIVYSYYSDSSNLLQMLLTKFTHIQRISFVFHDPLNQPKTFLNDEPFFTDDDLILGQTTFSDNVTFLKNLISQFTVSNIDFLACNSLLYDNWKTYYHLLTDTTTVIVGASDNLSGNIKYGADWVMENTNTDIKTIYFNDNISNFSGYLATFSVGVFNYDTGTSSTNATLIGYDNSSIADLIIPDDVSYNGISYNVTAIATNAFKSKTNLTDSLTIGNNVITIGNYAFKSCNRFTGSLNLGTSVQTIGDGAFQNCYRFTGNFTIPNTVITIGNNAFEFCRDFTGGLTIPNSVTTIGNQAFIYCYGFTTVTIGSGVTSIGNGVFRVCTSLAMINVDQANNAYSSDLYGVLFNYNKTTLIKYPIANIQSEYAIPNTVETISDYAFVASNNLTTITIGNSVTTIGANAFQACVGFTGDLTIPDSVQTINNYAFVGCYGFTGSLIIGNNVTSIGFGAFRDCYGFTGSLTIGTSVQTIDQYAFQNCYGFTGDLTIPDSVISISYYVFKGCYGFTGSLTIGNSVTYIGIEAFANCSGFVSITIGTSVTTIDTSAFNGCSGLTALTIPDSVTTIGSSAFYDCTSLTSVTFGNSVTTIGGSSFYRCTSLVSLTFGNSVTTISGSAFYKCSSLTVVVIPDSVTNIGGTVFAACTSLTVLTIGDGVTSLGTWAFDGCTSLTDLTIGNSVEIIGDGSFYRCTSLTDVVVPDSVITIKQNAFIYCSSLTNLTIGNSVTYIGLNSFYDCTSLTALTIPDSVTYIGTNAFQNCTSLNEVYVVNSENITTVYTNSFTDLTGGDNYTGSIIRFGNNEVTGAWLQMIEYYNETAYEYTVTLTISNVCFPAGTPIHTNQGIICVDLIDPKIHTIRDKQIVAITKTITHDKYLVCFDKNALGNNLPSQQTIITNNHKIFYNGKMVKSKYLLGKSTGVKTLKYTGEVLYNVLLENHDKMIVNNLICETLHPQHEVAQLYTLLNKTKSNQHEKIIKIYNNYIIKNNLYKQNKDNRPSISNKYTDRKEK